MRLCVQNGEFMHKGKISIGAIFDTISSLFIYILLAVSIVVIVGQAKRYYNIGYGIFSQEAIDAPGTGRDVTIEVTQEMASSSRLLGDALTEAGLVESTSIFTVQSAVSDYADQIVPGTYTLSTEMTTEEMMAVMAGAAVYPEAASEEGTGQ